ncbi:MAG: glycosyltransferase [Marmoricola sp.]
MGSSPRVSVCIPAYQAETHLAATLRSVLEQTYANLEIVALDNACTDGTADVLAGFTDDRLRVERNERVLPLAENWNHLLGLATGDLVKVVCADDLVHPDIVARQVALFVGNPKLAVVSCRRHLIAEGGQLVAMERGLPGLLGPHTGRNTVRKVVRNGGNPIGEPASVMFRRDDFVGVGGFDAGVSFPMDLDLWVRLLRLGDFYGMPDALAAFRAGSASLSSRATSRQYAEQRRLTARIGRDPFWRVGRTSRLVGRAGGVQAEAKHRALFLASAWTSRRAVERGAGTEADLSWLG